MRSICALSTLLWPSVLAVQQGCQFRPVVVPITDVTISNGAKMRGAQIAVGSPPQTISFLMDFVENNTWVYDTEGQCNNQTVAFCTTYRGGLFDESKSSTFVAEPDAATADAVVGSANYKSNWGTDVLKLNTNTSLPKFPIGIPRQDLLGSYSSQHLLGLGPSSDLLSVLKSSGQIGSRTVSYFWGLSGATDEAQMDGSLVLGGYDAAKATGQSITLPLVRSTKCTTGMVVSISKILLNFPNASTSDILGQNSISACLNPDFPVMATLAYEGPMSNYVKYTATDYLQEPNFRSWGVNFFGVLFNNSNVYQGDITFELAGIQIRIPNSQFLIPDLRIDGDTGKTAYNTSVTELLINPLLPPNDQDTSQLGKQFFTSAYLMVDYDNNTFTLWKANPTTTVNIVPIMNGPPAQSCAPIIVSPPAASPTNTAKEHQSLSGGAIGGIVIGAVAVIGLLALLAAVFLRKRKSHALVPAHDQHNPPMSGTDTKSWKDRLSELPPQEMDGNNRRTIPAEMG